MKDLEKETRPYWQKIVMVLTLGWVAIWIYRTALTPIYPQISAFFGNVSSKELGLISSSYFLGYVCTQIPSGILVDKYGRKKVMIPGFLIFALGALCVGLSKSLTFLYFGGILAGIGCGTYYGIAYSLTGIYVPKEKKSLATAIVNSGTAVGSGAGLILSSYLVKQLGLPWQYLMFGIVAIVLLMTALFMRVIKVESKEDIKEDKQLKEVAEQPVAAEQSIVKSLFKAELIVAYILYFATCYAFYLIDTWLPDFLASERGMDGIEGLVTSLIFFSAIPGALLFSRLADKYHQHKEKLIVMLAVIATVLLYSSVIVKQPALLIAGFALYGFFGKLAIEPIIISWISEKVKGKSIATTLGIFNFFGMSSAVIAPLVTGWIADVTSSKQLAFYLAAVIMVIGAAGFYLVNVLGKSKKIN
ncbi:MFS transporter [Tuanshanicoccus yangjingiae]|uniref:MFS transporter n=1 Tax=Aerococcaceae bacterium zg-252 TaxID=2796928 RepID=UPI00406303A5